MPHRSATRARSRPLLLLIAAASFARAQAATPTPAPTPPAPATLELEGLRGKVVYVDFWASWCGPCRHSFPWMQQMLRTYGADGFTVVTVNVDHERADAERFLEAYGPALDVRYDPEGSLAQQYGVQGMPTSFLVDRQGRRRYLHKGFVGADAPTYERQIRTLLAEGPQAGTQ